MCGCGGLCRAGEAVCVLPQRSPGQEPGIQRSTPAWTPQGTLLPPWGARAPSPHSLLSQTLWGQRAQPVGVLKRVIASLAFVACSDQSPCHRIEFSFSVTPGGSPQAKTSKAQAPTVFSMHVLEQLVHNIITAPAQSGGSGEGESDVVIWGPSAVYTYLSCHYCLACMTVTQNCFGAPKTDVGVTGREGEGGSGQQGFLWMAEC